MRIRSYATLMMFPILVLAQEYRGTIRGRVVDPSGAAVAGATINVTSSETNVATRTTSNELGNYQAPFLLPGDYMVSVEHPGFKKLRQEGVHVSINEPVTLDLSLELGPTAETVTVTAAAPLLNTASADLGQVVNRTYVDMVAVALTRNAVNFAQLAAGVTGGLGTVTSNAQSGISISGGAPPAGRTSFWWTAFPTPCRRATA